MADILVHNAIKDIEAAINQGSSKINYGPMLGKTLKLYIKDIIDANATGPYGTPGGGAGNATQPICDLSNYLKISYCLCAYAGSGTSCTDTFYNCPVGCPSGCYSVWRDKTVLPGNPGGSAVTKSDVRTFILNVESSNNGLKVLEAIYTASTTEVENDMYLAYLGLKADYEAAADDDVLFAWYGIGGSYPQGSRISNTDYIKVCGGSWMNGEGANCTWQVPAGATCARFQLWGAGQGSNPGCCCGGSPGGSNGAYTEMTIKVTPGDSYTICAGCAQNGCCCSAYTPPYGCMSYVTGNGICCLKADGEFCYNTNCESFRCVKVCTGSAGGGCWYWGSQYCTNSGHCWCSQGEYCAVGCSTCGVVPVYANCWTSGGGQFCNCATTACDIAGMTGETMGMRGLIGGGCFDTNHYGYHIRPPIVHADTGLMFSDTCGCYCQQMQGGSCCGGVYAISWGAHPGHGGFATHVMGGANQFYGMPGKGGMVQVSWVTT